jgi:hypothetical protein
MSQYDIYIFILCFIVFLLFTLTFGVLLTLLVKSQLRLIRAGLEDDNIVKEDQAARRKNSCLGKTLDCVVSLVLCGILLVFFAFSTYVNLQEDKYFENVPTLKVVNSGSMAKVHPNNAYLDDLGIDNRFNTFDLISVYDVPSEEELALYDVVLYEVDGIDLVHRIVGIEEPNEQHPDERYFLLQGDAVESPDRFPVHYDQIKAIWKGQRIPFVGSFVLFMQSPAGWLCMLLVVFAVIATPRIEKKLTREKLARLSLIQGVPSNTEKEDATL